jgi:glycosyltransferase involved in cell wall biosynthesis
VLVEAVAAGRPVIATRFPHAVEMLNDGRGILVPHQDPTAIADALRTLLTRRTTAAAGPDGSVAELPELWPAVAVRYRQLAERLISLRVAV